jgi:hypothetical protein
MRGVGGSIPSRPTIFGGIMAKKLKTYLVTGEYGPTAHDHMRVKVNAYSEETARKRAIQFFETIVYRNVSIHSIEEILYESKGPWHIDYES